MKIEFDLQLFSDGEETGTTEQDSSEKQYVEKVGLDNQGNVRIIKEEVPAAAPAQETPNKEQFYSPEEVREQDFDKLDPNKIPPDMVPWYKSMQAGFTRKQQELAQQQRFVQEFLEQAKQRTPEPAPQAPPPPAPQQQKQAIEQLTNAAKEQVRAMFGEDFDEFNPTHVSALTLMVQQMYSDANQAMMQKRQAEQVEQDRQNNLRRLESDLRTKEKDFDQVLHYIDGKLADLPFKEYAKIQEAYAKGDAPVLNQFFDDQRKAYYAEKTGVKQGVKPPKLESTGGNPPPEQKGPPNYAEFGRLRTFDEKLAWLRQNGIKP